MTNKPAKKQSMSPAMTRGTQEKRLLERVLELEEKNSSLESRNKTLEEKVETLVGKVTTLETTVSQLLPLKTEIGKLIDQNAVLNTVTENLSKENERLQQYSRRNCIVLEGIPVHKNENIQALEGKVENVITKELGISREEFMSNFDKTHRIGPVRNNNEQRVIVRFQKHSVCEKIYAQRKKSRKYKVKPSLTNFCMNMLKATKERFEKCEHVNFIYADIHGNLKIRFNQPLDGRYVYNFNDESELSNLIHDIENRAYSGELTQQ